MLETSDVQMMYSIYSINSTEVGIRMNYNNLVIVTHEATLKTNIVESAWAVS